eukprot:scaffold20093_cov63-Phaeocystis_antarctica.AAC.2
MSARPATPRDPATPRTCHTLWDPATCATLRPRLQCSAVGGPRAWRAFQPSHPRGNPLSPPP